jgi:subtilase family serine protease
MACGSVFAQAPVLFFSDITSGPNTGGENGNGAYVTIYGNYLGSSQGGSTVAAGGGAMVNCQLWGGERQSHGDGERTILECPAIHGSAGQHLLCRYDGQ